MIFFRHLIFCLIVPFSASCFSESDPLIQQADEYYRAALYSQAIPLYQQILRGFSEENRSSLYIKLARSYYNLDNLKEAIQTVQENLPDDPDGLYLSALSYRKLGQHDQAIQLLNGSIQSGPDPYVDEKQFELGLNHFQLGRLKEAQAYFRSISSRKEELHVLSRIYLIRIGLLQGNTEEAEVLLDSLSIQIAEGDPLHYELAYLQGKALFQRQDYAYAADCFTRALPKHNREICPWFSETLYHQGWSYLKLGEDPLKNAKEQKDCFQKAVESFQTVLKHYPEEKVYLALGQCYLTQARCLKDEMAYLQAEELLSKQKVFLSREAQAHALLLRAEAASSYFARDKFYRQLTQEANAESGFYAKGWYLRGLNDFEEGQSLLSNDEPLEARKAFERSAAAFRKAFEQLKGENTRAALALKYQAQACEQQNTQEGRLQALALLNSFFFPHSDMLMSLDHPDEIFFLKGHVASVLSDEELAERTLKEGLAKFPRGMFADSSLNLLGVLYYRQGLYKEAEATYLLLANEFPNSPFAGDAWFWAANCAEKMGSLIESKNRRRKVFENYPTSDFSAEAYFSYYTYRDYLQGDRTALKHLQAMAKEHPHSPFLIQAHYLIALDYKRDRKTPEGKWIRKKNLTSAIDAFQEAESLFDALSEKNLIPSECGNHYLMIRYRATLERALANLAIADESQGAKRQIYLEYAEEVFKQLTTDLGNPEHPLTKQLAYGDSYTQIQEESSFWLAQTHIKAQNDEAAEKIFSLMLDRYHASKTTKGYFLSRVWYEQGMIDLRKKDYALALQCFKHAEEAAKGRVLNTDQKLDLWIQQSFCYRGLNQWDDAILILSKVINDDAISGLRLKAMVLRAEIYELQERRELARKQLQTTAKKGGEWALIAKEKLEKDYGY